MESREKERVNGDRPNLAFELSNQERAFIFDLHQRHMNCKLDQCVAHSSVHLVLRLEAGLREARWKQVHGIHYGPETCPDERHQWSPMDWVREVIKSLEGK